MPFRSAYITARGVATHREGLIVRLTADDGNVGLGEANLLPEASASLADMERALDAVASKMLGNETQAVWGYRTWLPYPRLESYEAIGPALSTAASDLDAQAAGLSVARLLLRGWKAAHARVASTGDAVSVNALVSAPSTGQAARIAAKAKAQGFGTVKLKVGVASLDEDYERVAAVRDAIGPDLKLRLDANGAWSEEQAIASIRALAAFDIEYVEQPTAPGDLDSLRRVQDAVAIPIAADEDAASYEAAQRVIEMRAARVLIVKPQVVGGPQQALWITELAAKAGLQCVVTTTIDTGVATAAALHLAATLPPDGPAHGLATASLLEADLLRTPLSVEGGVMRLPAGPGLGVELDEAALAKYAVSEGRFP